MNTFKKLFSITAILALLATTLPIYAMGGASYSDELIGAYEFAAENGITSATSIDNFNTYGSLTRIAMAKMMANYSMDVLGNTPDTTKDCSFPDVSTALDAQYDNGVTNACQLGLMGVGITNFNPRGKVTRAEFGTVLSRAMYGEANNGSNPYYAAHLDALKDAGIMNNISNPMMLEVRGYVALMMQRGAEDTDTTTDGCSAEELLACITATDYDACIAECSGDVEDEDENVLELDGNLEVSISRDTMDSADLPQGAEGITVVTYTIEATDSDVDLLGAKLERIGMGAADAVKDVAFFTENGRVTKAKDFSSSDDYATLTFSPILTIKRGESIELKAIVSTEALAPAYSKFAVSLVELTTTAEDVDANYPIVGEEMTIGSATAAEVTINDDGSVSDVKVGDENVEVLKFSIENGSDEEENVFLNSITLKEDGTIDEEDEMSNFSLYYEGEEVAFTESSVGKYITFNLDDAIEITEGDTEKFSVRADIDGGANTTIKLYIDKDLDISIAGDKYGYVMITNDLNSANVNTTTNVDAGEITLVDIDAEFDKIRADKDNVVLGEVKITNIAGKNLELDKFGVKIVATTPGTQNLVDILENVELYNESNGASYDLTADDDTGLTTFYNDTDLDVVIPQGTLTLVLRADIIDGADVDTTLEISMNASLNGSNTDDNDYTDGMFVVIEAEDDNVVTDLTPSSLTWKKLTVIESAVSATSTTLASTSVVRGTANEIAMQFELEATEASDVEIDEVKVYVEADVDGAGQDATNQEIAEVVLYKDSISTSNVLDRVGGSSLADGVATFDGFTVDIAADETQTFIVVVSIIDGADAVTNSTYQVSLTSVDAEDDDNDAINVNNTAAATLLSLTPLVSAKEITVTNAGELNITADSSNDDNEYQKTILAGTSEAVMSVDVLAVNEPIDVETVVFTTTTDLTAAVETASLYLGEELIDTNTNADIAFVGGVGTITFDNLTTLIISEETEELRLVLNTNTIGYEKVGDVIVDGVFTDVALSNIEGVDSGKTVTDDNVAVVAGTSIETFDILPAIVTPVVLETLDDGSAKIQFVVDNGDNTVAGSNSDVSIALQKLVFADLGNDANYSIYKEGDAAGAVAITDPANVNMTSFGAFTADETFIIVPAGTVDNTYALKLTKQGVEYKIDGSATYNSNTMIELDLGSKTY